MIKRLLFPMAVLLGAFSIPASALTITAEFIPRVTGANTTKFVNTTPVSGYCADFARECRPGEFTVIFPLTVERLWRVPGPIESHNYQRVDGGIKSVQVTNDVDGQTVELQFRLSMLARTYNRGTLQPGGVYGGMYKIGERAGLLGPTIGSCQGRNGYSTETRYMFPWTVPTGVITCSRPADPNPFGPYAGTIDQVSIGYELKAPNPFLLSNGTYRGTLTYSLGRGGQIDLGEGNYSDTLLNLDFELTVRHELRVDFPAGSDRAVLEPDGGWQQWLHRGTPPTTLRRDHPFQIWASAPMKIYLTCGEALGTQCSLREPLSGHQVPFGVAVTLPGSIRHQGAPVQNLPLPVGEAQALNFTSIAVANASPGRLRYAVDPAHIGAMLANSGRQYSGDVTIVFDAQI